MTETDDDQELMTMTHAPTVARRGRRSPEVEAMATRLASIVDESVVYEVTADDGEKLPTVRKHLERAARIARIEIAIRRSPRGFYVGLMTDARRSTRGRRRSAQPGSIAAPSTK